MKRNLLLFFIFLCAFAVKAQQYTLTDDDVVVTNGVIMSCSYDFTLTDIIIPETLGGQTVTEIWGDPGVSNSVFRNKGLTSVQFPETLLKIGRYTFSSNSLSEVVIPNSVTEIGEGAFVSNQLTSVTLPTSITVIESQVFSSNNLTSITIPEGVTEIEEFAFWVNSLTSVSLPNSVTKIGEKAFGGSSGLASVTLPTVATTGFISWIDEDGNTYENGAVVTNVASFFIAQFAQTLTDDDVVVVDGIITSCTLNDTTTSITIPEVLDGQTIIGLGDNLFSGDALTAVSLPETVTTIGDYVFYNCNLTSIALPSGLSSIGDYAFSSNSLTEVLLPESLTSLGSYAFAYNNLIEVNIPGSVTVIEDNAFRSNYDLAKVTINEGVTAIGDNAFGFCYDLTDLSIPNSVTYIGENAFNNISGLASFTLPTPTKTGYTVNWIDSNSVEYATGAEVTDKAVSYSANFEINTYVISGTVSGADGVSLTLSGDVEEIQTVTASGDTFSFSVEYNKSVVLTASKLGYLFDTEEYSFPNIYGDKTETNFTASINEEINTYVPDNNFEQALIDLGYDTDLDDYVLTENINTLTSLNVSSKNIADLTGIEDFVALTQLQCYSNQLTSLDVSLNTEITYLSCESNQLTGLNLETNVILKYLLTGRNNLTNLDLSSNLLLSYLDCDYNQLTDLDVKLNTELTTLVCRGNQILNLDVSLNAALTTLLCGSNQIASLDVSLIPELSIFECNSNGLTNLDLSANTALTYLNCQSNQLARLNLKNGNNTSINTFWANGNPNLTCIEVDDADWSTTNWTSIDAQSYFNEESCYTYVPDDNFEQALIDLDYDTDLDDYVLTDNINTLLSLDVASKNIADLTGIEDFVALTNLNCYSNALTSLDVSNNLNLNGLQCYYNKISTLDLSANTLLQTLYCGDNLLTTLDVSLNTALVNLGCTANQLTTLDLSNNINLRTLGCPSNELISLDVSANTALTSLVCESNQLTSLDVSVNTALTNLSCYSNSLTSLDLSANTALTSLSCYSNSLTRLNVKNGNNIALTTFYADENPNLTCIQVDDADWSTTNWTDIDVQSYFNEESCFTYVPDDNFEQALIDLGYDTDLDDYVLTENISSLTSLNVSSKNIADLTGIEDFVALTSLSCYLNELTSLDVSANTALETLYCYSNELTKLDISKNTLLRSLICAYQNITELDVSNNLELNTLQIDDNNITSLDVTKNINLYTLSCKNNLLSILDVSLNINLVSLNCENTGLESLDVSKNTKLQYLTCNSNGLTDLDVSSNLNLNRLYCSSNKLSTLDVSLNTALEKLKSNSNNLISLNVKNGNNVNFDTTYGSSFEATNNPDLTCINVDDAEWSTTNWTDIDDTASFGEYCDNLFTYIPDDNFEQALIDLGYDTILDDYVLTENINTITSLDVASKNIADLTGIEDFPALTYLRLSYNNLTTLDVSNNIALEKLYCGTNALTSLDVSVNTALINFYCDVNELTSLDVSANTALINFRCESNNLTSLNIANGNNINFTKLWAYSNPDLTCIQVDDAEWSTTNWTDKDATASFSEDCSSTLATDNYEIENFKVYPNPSNGDVYISVSEEAAYQLVNLTGQIVKQGKLVNGVNNLNLTGFNKGIYFVKIKTDNAIHTEKLIFK